MGLTPWIRLTCGDFVGGGLRTKTCSKRPRKSLSNAGHGTVYVSAQFYLDCEYRDIFHTVRNTTYLMQHITTSSTRRFCRQETIFGRLDHYIRNRECSRSITTIHTDRKRVFLTHVSVYLYNRHYVFVRLCWDQWRVRLQFFNSTARILLWKEAWHYHYPSRDVHANNTLVGESLASSVLLPYHVSLSIMRRRPISKQPKQD